MTVTPHQHQKWTHTERGNSSGLCASTPAAADQSQHSQIGVSLPGRRWPMFRSSFIGLNSRDRAVTGCGSHFHSSRHRACKPSARHSLPYQKLSKHIAGVRLIHRRRVLSQSSSSAGFKTSWKDLTFGTEPLSRGDKIHD